MPGAATLTLLTLLSSSPPPSSSSPVPLRVVDMGRKRAGGGTRAGDRGRGWRSVQARSAAAKAARASAGLFSTLTGWRRGRVDIGAGPPRNGRAGIGRACPKLAARAAPRDSEMISVEDVWRSYMGVQWIVQPRGPLRNLSDSAEPFEPIRICAILQTHDLKDLLGEPWQFSTHNRKGPWFQELDDFGQVDMEKLNISQIYDVNDPDEVARRVEELEPEVLLIDYYHVPWTGELLLSAIQRRAKKTGFKRPKYILGIADAPFLNRLIVEVGADGYIKKKMIHGWELWPRTSVPEPINVTERVYKEDQESWKKEEEERTRQFIDYLRKLDANGELDEYRDVRGYSFFSDNPRHKEACKLIRWSYEREKVFYDFVGIGKEPRSLRNGTERPALEGNIFGMRKRINPNNTIEDLGPEEKKDEGGNTPYEIAMRVEREARRARGEENEHEFEERQRKQEQAERERAEEEERKRKKEENEKYYP